MKSKLYCTVLSHLTQLKIDVAGFFCSCLYDCEDLCGTLCCFQDFGSTKQSCGCQGVQLHPTFGFGSRVSIFLAMSNVFVDIYIYVLWRKPFWLQVGAVGIQVVSLFWFWKIARMVAYKLGKAKSKKAAWSNSFEHYSHFFNYTKFLREIAL